MFEENTVPFLQKTVKPMTIRIRNEGSLPEVDGEGAGNVEGERIVCNTAPQ